MLGEWSATLLWSAQMREKELNYDGLIEHASTVYSECRHKTR